MSDALYALTLNGSTQMSYQFKDLFKKKTVEEERKENEEKATNIIVGFYNKCKEYQ